MFWCFCHTAEQCFASLKLPEECSSISQHVNCHIVQRVASAQERGIAVKRLKWWFNQETLRNLPSDNFFLKTQALWHSYKGGVLIKISRQTKHLNGHLSILFPFQLTVNALLLFCLFSQQLKFAWTVLLVHFLSITKKTPFKLYSL